YSSQWTPLFSNREKVWLLSAIISIILVVIPFTLVQSYGNVFEVKAFNERYHSWFIGQSVQHGKFYVELCCFGKFQPVEQVVVDEAFPGCIQLLKCSQTLQCLSHVTEKKEVGSQSFYRYNKDKTLTWLKKKVLYHSNLIIFVQVTIFIFLPLLEDYLRYAHGLVSEYISEDLSKDLLKYLQLPELSNPTELEPPSKKRKLSDNPVEAEEDYTKFNNDDHKKKPTKKMTPAQKALAKVDKTGMKTLSAFFSPKSKN
uniref:Ribonuclease H2, subunit B n=1 Tax=Erpetoichthys calabaricus TaxID=27687 RepID=A0A8C4XF69_ERPCA